MNFVLKITASVLLIIIFSVLIVKKEVSQETNQVLINATILEDDTLQIFYLVDDLSKYTEKYSVKKPVTASGTNQTLQIKIPQEFDSNLLRIDLGENQNQRPIKINSVSITHMGESILLRGTEIYKMFKPNQFVSVNKDSTTLSFKTVQGRYDPYLYASQLADVKARADFASYTLMSPSLVLLSLTLLIIMILMGFKYKEVFSMVSYSTLFLLFLLAPLIVKLLDSSSLKNIREKRELAEMPNFTLLEMNSFPAKFTSYFNDNFGLRDALINYGGLIKLILFKSSHTSHVALGKSNWLFLSGSFDNILMNFARKDLYEEKKLASMVEKWETRKRTLRFKNIGFYKAFWPNKHTVYPEHLPYIIRMQQVDTLSRTDQVIKYLKKTNSNIDLIDVRDDLIRAKKKVQLYLKHDTHWNDYGAFIAYNKLIETISTNYPHVKPLSVADFKIKWETTYGGDLTDMLGVNPKNYRDRKPIFIPIKKEREITELPSRKFPPKTRIFFNDKCSNNLTVLIFRDSFTSAMIKFISPHFKKTIYVWTSYDPELVELVQPDIVVEAYVERLFR